MPLTQKAQYGDLVDWTALLGGKLFYALICHLPYPLALGIARIGVLCFRILFRRADAVGKRNLGLVFPEKSQAERKRILKASYEILAKNVVAFATIEKLTAERVAEMIDYSEFRALSEQARQKSPNVGIILPTMHFGCFEFLGQVQALLGRPGAVLARGFGIKRFDKWYNQKREIFGHKVFFRHGGYRETMERLKKSQDVLMLIDQNVKSNHATFVDFFGIKAATTKMVAIASLRTGAPVIFTAGAEVSRNRYKLIVKALPDIRQETGTVEEQIQKFTQRLSNCMEEVILEFPDHWFWVHRRFKTRPPGEAEDVYT